MTTEQQKERNGAMKAVVENDLTKEELGHLVTDVIGMGAIRVHLEEALYVQRAGGCHMCTELGRKLLGR